MKKALVFIIAVAITGCVNSRDIIDQSAVEHIERGSTVMVYHYPGSRSALYDEIYDALLADGFRIDQENEERGSITTEGKSIGQSTKLRMQIYIEELAQDSAQATFRPEYRPGQDAEMQAEVFSGIQMDTQFKPATWGDSGRPERAYAYTYKFIQQKDPALGKEAIEHRQ